MATSSVSVKYLLFRPGHLSSEYMKGRRASYLHPVRMYVFTSAIFFLIFFSMYHLEQEDIRRRRKRCGEGCNEEPSGE